MKFEACESRQEETSEVTALKAEVADLRKDVDYLKSTNFTSLLEADDDVDTPETSKIPLATTEDVHRDDATVDESKTETDDEQIEIRKESIYGDLPDLKEMIVQAVIQTSLTETSMVAHSGPTTYEVTPGTDAQTAERTKKIRPDDRLTHWASRQMAMISPKALVCQALKEKIKSAIERSSRQVTKWFRDAVLDHPKLQNLKMLKAKAKGRLNRPKGGSSSGSAIPTYCA
ncbi:hypothetical protein H5410_051494 [Solanum commersonii]|uniref:Uncharacterized protein n=1 Tax=Solanum commersonii TaxID=4109 RepID=A0A9J5WYK1_SOLCO|nr:hypothetical protein H5410_051494 [Solanum commersonii]